MSQSRHASLNQLLRGRISLQSDRRLLSEFVWVLSRGYGIPTADIAAAIRGLIGSANVEVNRPAVEAGLALLDQGGDFADGIIAFEGASLGGAMFATFDKDAAKRLKKLGRDTLLLA